MCLGKDAETIGDFNFQGISIKKTNSQKLLGVIIDHKLKFEEHKFYLSNSREETERTNKIIPSNSSIPVRPNS